MRSVISLRIAAIRITLPAIGLCLLIHVCILFRNFGVLPGDRDVGYVRSLSHTCRQILAFRSVCS